MKALLGIAVVGVTGALVWQLGSMLSTDAVGMAVGLLFGVLSGIPAALLVLAAPGARRQHDAMVNESPAPHTTVVIIPPTPRYTVAHPFAIQPAQPTVPPAADDDCPDWCEPWVWQERTGRQFRIVGETE